MDWKALGKKIAGTGATLLGGAIGGPGGARLGGMVADALGLDTDDPDSIATAIDQDPEAALKLAEIQSAERVSLREISSRQAIAELEADTARQKTVNETMRSELQAQDNYRGRWRPTFGYVMAANMAIITLGFFCAIVAVIFTPESAGAIAAGFAEMLSAFVVIFSLGLGVLGVQVHQRSKDKRLAAGAPDPGILQKLGSVVGAKGPAQ